jgi:hypothetical protein
MRPHYHHKENSMSEETTGLDIVERRRALAADIVHAIDDGRLSARYVTFADARQGQCYCCAIGAAYVAQQKFDPANINCGPNVGNSRAAMESFGYTMEDIGVIEYFFEAGYKHYGDAYPLNRTDRMRQIWQELHDTESVKPPQSWGVEV